MRSTRPSVASFLNDTMKRPSDDLRTRTICAPRAYADLQLQVSELRDLAEKAFMQGEALKDCLIRSGLVMQRSYTLGLQRRRCARIVSRVFVVDELMERVSSSLRLRDAFALAGVSKDVRTALRETVAGRRSYVYICGGMSDRTSSVSTHVDRIDPQGGSWEDMPSMKHARAGATGVPVHGCLYVCGGYEGGEVLNTVERFDPEYGQWEELPRMLERKRLAMGVALQGRLCVGGGWTTMPAPTLSCAGGLSHTMDYFDPESWEWASLQELPQRRAEAVMEAVNGIIYLCGGVVQAPRVDGKLPMLQVEGSVHASEPRFGGNRFLPTVHPAPWIAVSDMNVPRRSAGSASHDGCLYVCGGTKHCDEVLRMAERYDPRTGCWEEIASMQQPRYFPVIIAIDRHIYAFGGYGYHTYAKGTFILNSVERFCPHSGVWKEMPGLARQYACGKFAGGLLVERSWVNSSQDAAASSLTADDVR